MSNTALDLSPEELEIIEARRAETQRKEDEEKAREQARYDDHIRRSTQNNETKLRLFNALRDADEDGIFRFEKTYEKNIHPCGEIKIFKPKITFVLNDREESVPIEEHTPSSGGYYSSRSKGYKYHLYGGFNNYCDRWYKNPNTLVTRVKEFQDNLVARKRNEIETKNRKETDRKDARNLATKAYPNARIEVSETSNIVFVKRDDVGTLSLNWVRDYQTNTMKLVYNSVKLADELHTEILAKFEA